MLPFLGDEISEWKGFKAKHFFYDIFPAHKTLYNTVHLHLKVLKDENIKKKEEEAA